MTKIFGACGVIVAGGVVMAQQVDPSVPTGALALFAVITLLTNALVAGYSKFRQAKTEADTKDTKKQLEELQKENEDLKDRLAKKDEEINAIIARKDREFSERLSEKDKAVEQWKNLYQAVISGNTNTRSTRQKREPG